MHPYVTGLMAQAHRDDLLADAARHRLLAEAAAAGGRPRAALLTRLRETVGRLTRPVPAPEPSAACCPA
ncbi:hypothetical protein [Knoellia aerolata]|uniref:Uncharacterized protein n=1 Tax=Knoellia aerolata DSM 18566 TaxID=1385519 RepID=A0A0A0JLK5_9MICO|nr:hypothetical protein [Knoellia aerolata]KGN37639.1 hypothetical protein N801_00900 [Knoellia aerolata DSM 18566]